MRNKSIKITLLVLLLLAAITTTYSILTYGLTHITSDCATSYLLSKSIAENGSLFPASWNSANGEIWFLNSPLMALPFNLLMANKPLARMIGSVIAVATTCLGMAWFSKRVYKDSSYLVSIPLFLIFVTGTTAADADLYQAAYTFILLWLVVCPGLFYFLFYDYQKDLLKKHWLHLALYAVITVGLLMGGNRYLAEQTLPLILTVLTMVYFQLKAEKVGSSDSGFDTKAELGLLKKGCLKALISLAIICLPSLIGRGIYNWLNSTRYLNESGTNGIKFVDSVSDLFSNLLRAIQNLYIDFGFTGSVSVTSTAGLRNMVSIIICTIICIIIPILAYKQFDEEDEAGKFYLVFAFWHNLILLTVVICCGKTHERWILTVILVDLIIAARYIYRNWLSAKDLSRYFWTCCFVLASLVEMLYMVKLSDGYKDIYANERNVANQLIEHGLTKGYASFWNAYSTEVYTDGQVEFAGIRVQEDKLFSYYWLVDNSRFEITDGPTFLMLTEEENAAFADYIHSTLGQETEAFTIENAYMYSDLNLGNGYVYTNLYVYVFDYDISKNIRNGVHDGVLSPNELFFNYCGSVNDDGSFVIETGGIVQGPYSEIDSGDYLVTFEGANLSSAAIELTLGEGEDGLAYLEEIDRGDGTITCNLHVSKKVDSIDFRVLNLADGQIVLKDILVEKQ